MAKISEGKEEERAASEAVKDEGISIKMDYIAEQEEANEHACVECAKANGFTAEQADNCDAGDLDCKCCPWGGKEEGIGMFGPGDVNYDEEGFPIVDEKGLPIKIGGRQ